MSFEVFFSARWMTEYCLGIQNSVGLMSSLLTDTGEGGGSHPRFCTRVFFQEAFRLKDAMAALKLEIFGNISFRKQKEGSIIGVD